ncbi:MAG: aldo/keto reductase [Turicibacter sp.]|nr:aldo/keto reductase [Turicibacter sp.]
MEKTRLGKTNLEVSRTGFGAIPIQRITDEESTAILRKAFEAGVTYYDTARGYTTSESKIGKALGDVREKVIIATKTHAKTGEEFDKSLAVSLAELGSDYIDIFQFHNPPFLPRPDEENGLYDAALRAKAEGKIRHIGVTSHRLPLAREMVESGLFDTMQFPMSPLATPEEIELVELCKKHDVGYVAMKGLAGGLITNAKTSFAFLRRFQNVVPIWGIQFMWQLDEFLSYEKNPPAFDDEIKAIIAKDKAELSGNFCRACGYCLPCPSKINIPTSARMRLLLGRTEWNKLIIAEMQAEMARIDNCLNCRHCADRCPYNIDTPQLLKENLDYYKHFVAKNA